MYNDFIPQELAQLLRNAGMPIRKQQEECGLKAEGADEQGFRWLYKIPYWEIFNIFLKKGIEISVRPRWADTGWAQDYCWEVCNTNENTTPYGDLAVNWQDAANAAIRKASEILPSLKENNKSEGIFASL